MRILVAEDETIIRLDLREILERAGYSVVAEARDGEEAVELAASQKPDLAILDVKMPKLDGIDAARRILTDRPIPIVILTAYGQDELVARSTTLRVCSASESDSASSRSAWSSAWRARAAWIAGSRSVSRNGLTR